MTEWVGCPFENLVAEHVRPEVVRRGGPSVLIGGHYEGVDGVRIVVAEGPVMKPGGVRAVRRAEAVIRVLIGDVCVVGDEHREGRRADMQRVEQAKKLVEEPIAT